MSSLVSQLVEMINVNEVVMNVDKEVVKEVVMKSNKRRINFLTSKIAELTAELVALEALEEEFEASRSSNVTKRTKGRPQAKKEQVEEVDLFANLVKEVVSSADAVAEGAISECAVAAEEKPVASKPVKEKVSKPVAEKKEKAVKHVLSEEEKAAKKAELDKAKAEEKALKKAQLEADKLAKAEEKKAQLEADKVLKAAEKLAMAAADKEAKKAAIEQAKAEEKEAKKKALEAEKEAKKQALYDEKMTAALKKLETKQALAEAKRQEKAAKEKATKENAAKAKPESKAKKAEAVAPVAEVVAEKVTVSRITINDIKYLKSSTNILYNPDTREEVGLYDPETKMIKPLPDDEEEEMTEDTYESDNE